MENYDRYLLSMSSLQLTETELDDLLGAVVASSRRGVHLAAPGKPVVPNWSFAQERRQAMLTTSLLFSKGLNVTI
jgi:hypothetical protein